MRLLIPAATALVFSAAPVFAQDCAERLEGLQTMLGDENAYSTVLRAGMQDQIGMLWDVAALLQQDGDEEACRQIAVAMESIVTKVSTPGLVDGDLWNEQQAARLEAAVPVDELESRFHIDDVLGASVYSPRNDYLGEIDDLVITAQGIGYGVIERGGLLGIGDERIAVPWQRFAMTADGQTLVLDVDPQRIGEAPAYEDGLAQDETWRSESDAFFSAD